jgi:hypothetical protein
MADFAAAPAGEEDTFEYQRCGPHVRAAVLPDVQSAVGIAELLDDDPLTQAMVRLAEQDREKNDD